jgi:hypothetical protein
LVLVFVVDVFGFVIVFAFVSGLVVGFFVMVAIGFTESVFLSAVFVAVVGVAITVTDVVSVKELFSVTEFSVG